MDIFLKQTAEDMFYAEFDIIKQNEIIGKISMNGKLGSREVKYEGNIYDDRFELRYNGSNIITSGKKFRPYVISENGKEVGEIFQHDEKVGFFKYFTYRKLIYKGNEYFVYGIHKDEKTGAICTFLNDNEQISQIEVSNTIINGSRDFKIYCNEDYYFISVIIACYTYLFAGYEPGVKHVDTKKTYYTKMVDKREQEKYNPNWINEYKQK